MEVIRHQKQQVDVPAQAFVIAGNGGKDVMSGLIVTERINRSLRSALGNEEDVAALD